jgi:prephenate dehydratase
LRVAFQGERGAYSEEAVASLFPDAESVPCSSLSVAFEMVVASEADLAVVPIENSQAGSINETYDLLLRHDLWIYGETVCHIHHCLLALPDTVLEDVREVYSHPQALAQCEEFLRSLGVSVVPHYDTAGSAKMIRETKLLRAAAVASRRAADIYGLKILAENIETNPNNYTRFIVISQRGSPLLSAWQTALDASRGYKTSLVFATRNVPGALYHSLGAFATRGINLTKLESRPSRRRPWEYVFYVDYEGHVDDARCQDAMEDLRARSTFVKVLGSYPKGSEIEDAC